MELRAYLDEEPKRAGALAAAIGVHWTTVYRWARGENAPSLKRVAQIELATGGIVTARDFLGAAPAKVA